MASSSSAVAALSPVTTANPNRPDDLDDRCLPQYSALDNSYGHNPCQVARFLIDACEFYEFYPLRALDLRKGRQNYPVPDPYQATACLCSMGVYNLVQACAACQQTGPYVSTLVRSPRACSAARCLLIGAHPSVDRLGVKLHLWHGQQRPHLSDGVSVPHRDPGMGDGEFRRWKSFGRERVSVQAFSRASPSRRPGATHSW